MTRRGRRTFQGELRGFAASLLFAAMAYWFFSPGLYITVVTGVAGWYSEQVMPLPGMPTARPSP
jgi:hypothetical protein